MTERASGIGMKFLAGLSIWLLVSCARCEGNIMDKLAMADMDSTLGLFEKNFGESLTKKLSSALFQGTQKMRPPMEILLSFMKGLTSEEIESMTQGIISSVQELAELLKQPEAKEQLTFFINTAPTILAALSGGGVSDKFVPSGMGNEGDSGPIESKVNGKKKKKTAEDFKAEEMMETAGSLIKSGASLLGTSLGLDRDLTEPGGSLEQFATKLLEQMIEEGLLDEDMNYDPKGDEATPEQLAGEKPNGESKSDKVHKENENEKHSEL